ncbi:BsaWI family type II restriction enzyme [Natronomonas sp. EA1]|uniref:BsaWI family type II restriction enzyme n=1 Tax=Natronomonas sp. EA1 TaxID=3421655 RepID=UPI003EC09AED
MNQDVKSRIEQYTYWDIFEEDVNRRTDREILTDIEGLMTNVVDEVTARAEENGKDVSQVRSNVAGNYFQALVSYATADVAAENGLRLLHSKKLESTELADAVPVIGGEDETILSPDSDIVYYDPKGGPIFIISCKTSFRERMAQSGMWKLMFEVATHSCSDPDCPTHNYSFSGEFERDIYMGFGTVDFYDDVESKDIVELFDFGYAPTVDEGVSGVAYPMERLIDHIENEWSSFR